MKPRSAEPTSQGLLAHDALRLKVDLANAFAWQAFRPAQEAITG